MLEWTLQHTVESAALALLASLICLCLRPRPAARHALWLLVLLKLLTPPLLRWPWPLPSCAGPAAVAPAAPPAMRDPASAPPPADPPPPPAPAGTVPAAVEEPPIAPQAAEEIAPAHVPAPAEKSEGLPPGAWLVDAAGWVWAAGACACGLVQLTRLVRLRRLLRRGLAAPDWLRELTAEAARALRVRPPRVLVLDGAASPMVCALGAPRLLWPRGLEDRLPPDGRRAVVLHELAHLRRRDHWVGWLLLAGGCVWWWHPLFWWVRRRLTREAELACDACVVEASPEARKAYAEALLEVSKRPPAAAPVLGASSGRRDLERRLVMVMRGNGPGRLSWAGRVAVVALGVLALPAWTLGGSDEAKPAAPQPAGGYYYEPVTSYRQVTSYQPVTTYRLRPLDPAAAAPPSAPAPDPAREKRLKELEERVQQLLKEMEELRGPAAPQEVVAETPTAVAPPPPTPVAAPAVPSEVALSRVTYKLPSGHAEATAAFLRDHVGASVLETRAEGDDLIVTTTPETQKVIRMLVALVQSKPPVPAALQSDGPVPEAVPVPVAPPVLPSVPQGPLTPPPASAPAPTVAPAVPSEPSPPAGDPRRP